MLGVFPSEAQIRALASRFDGVIKAETMPAVILVCGVMDFIEAIRVEFGTCRTTHTEHKRARRGERVLTRKYETKKSDVDLKKRATHNSNNTRPSFIAKSNAQSRQLYGATSRSYQKKRQS